MSASGILTDKYKIRTKVCSIGVHREFARRLGCEELIGHWTQNVTRGRRKYRRERQQFRFFFAIGLLTLVHGIHLGLLIRCGRQTARFPFSTRGNGSTQHLTDTVIGNCWRWGCCEPGLDLRLEWNRDTARSFFDQRFLTLNFLQQSRLSRNSCKAICAIASIRSGLVLNHSNSSSVIGKGKPRRWNPNCSKSSRTSLAGSGSMELFLSTFDLS